MMIVTSVFVLVATSIYGTLANITHMTVESDSSVALEIQGQNALNSIIGELKTAGFYRLQTNQTLTTYSASLWSNTPWNDPHKSWDSPYLFAGDGVAYGVFAPLNHTPADHAAVPADEEYHATQEFAFIPIAPFVTVPAATPTATITWAASGLGAAANIVVPLNWQVISYELITVKGVNYLKRRARTLNQSNPLTLGGIVSEKDLARDVEAVRFDTAETDASLPLYTVKVTIWLRRKLASGELMQQKVQSLVALRNSI